MPARTPSLSIRSRAALLAVACSAALGSAHAADASFSSQAGFLGASPGGLLLESFEGLSGSTRAFSPITTPLLTLTPGPAAIGVQTAAGSAEGGFGASATDGTNYVSVYKQGEAQGTLTITLARPATAFGLTVTDVGEAVGIVRLSTNTGAYASGVDVYNFSMAGANGLVFFAGLTQNQAFTQVFLTVTGVDEAYGIDGLQFNALPVPEPATTSMLAAGLLGLGLLRRRRPLPRG